MPPCTMYPLRKPILLHVAIGSCCSALESSLLNKLKRKVEDLRSTKCSSRQEEEFKVGMIKTVVREYVTETQQSGSTKEYADNPL